MDRTAIAGSGCRTILGSDWALATKPVFQSSPLLDALPFLKILELRTFSKNRPVDSSSPMILHSPLGGKALRRNSLSSPLAFHFQKQLLMAPVVITAVCTILVVQVAPSFSDGHGQVAHEFDDFLLLWSRVFSSRRPIIFSCYLV